MVGANPESEEHDHTFNRNHRCRVFAVSTRPLPQSVVKISISLDVNYLSPVLTPTNKLHLMLKVMLNVASKSADPQVEEHLPKELSSATLPWEGFRVCRQ